MKSNKRKFLLFPLLSASLCLWQVKRYYEKKELIRNINEKAFSGIEEEEEEDEITSLEQLKELEYHRVTIQNGKQRVKESFMVGPKVKKGYGLGYYVHDTVEVGNGNGNGNGNGGNDRVVVNRGFVPEGRMKEFYYSNATKKEQEEQEEEEEEEEEENTPIRGVVYNQKYFMPSRMFRQTPHSDSDTCFIHVDTRRMGSQSEYFIMEIGDGDNRKIPIRSDDGVLNVPNKHLEYIATWGLLTAALLGMIFIK
ncbi:hypothetical protein MP638_005090 [Amoeboaphelidium occidentale]|nr:hypothetical protein MP638_005090 [Amoeboaphelidium occidentale]